MTNPPEPTPEAAAPAPLPAAKKPMKQRWLIIILALTFLFVLMPFLFWQATWFGRPLTDDKLLKALADREHPREIQHGLSQIADRVLAPDAATRESAKRFYPYVAQISRNGGDELRLTAAWVMGQDNTVPEFHEALLRLLGDSNPMVRRNAALGLIRFGDQSGHAEIRAILQPYVLTAPREAKLSERLKPADAINPGTLLGSLETGVGKAEFRSLVPGTINRWLVADGAAVKSGQPVMVVDPSDAEVWEALRALYIIGDKQDLPALDPYLKGGQFIQANVRKAAEMTAQAISSRGKP